MVVVVLGFVSWALSLYGLVAVWFGIDGIALLLALYVGSWVLPGI